jgi:hypothetical protein
MIGYIGDTAAWIAANPRWLASLAAAAAINVMLLGLMSWGHVGTRPRVESNPPAKAIDFVFRPRVPPPPDLSSATLAPEAIAPRLPARFQPKIPIQALTNVRRELALPAPQMRLDLNPCDPDDVDLLRKPDCAPPQEWLRAERDASEMFGPETKGKTLDEVAYERGWKVRKLPNTRLDSMAGRVDSTIPDSIFKNSPF